MIDPILTLRTVQIVDRVAVRVFSLDIFSLNVPPKFLAPIAVNSANVIFSDSGLSGAGDAVPGMTPQYQSPARAYSVEKLRNQKHEIFRLMRVI